MAAAQLPHVVSNWSKLIDNFETSSLEFYERVQEALAEREVPGITFSRREYDEGGSLTGKRIYLGVSREGLRFDICAAPFGRGFFFSWWLSEKRTSGLGIAMTYLVMAALWFGFNFVIGNAFWERQMISPDLPFGFVIVPLLALTATLVVSAVLAQARLRNFEDALLLLPVIGLIYRVLLRQLSFYRIDTMSMYRAAVHAAVLESIESLTMAKGIRALTEEDRKPILPELAVR